MLQEPVLLDLHRGDQSSHLAHRHQAPTGSDDAKCVFRPILRPQGNGLREFRELIRAAFRKSAINACWRGLSDVKSAR